MLIRATVFFFVVLMISPVWSAGLAPSKEIENSLGMKFVWIPSGEFMMGSDESSEALAKAFHNTVVSVSWRLESGANPHRLKIELTESLVLANVVDTIIKMQALKAIGVDFSMDDFGTGYSSLSYLMRLPLDQLKIDQSFICDIGSDSNGDVIV